jgi:hypothetical protein
MAEILPDFPRLAMKLQQDFICTLLIPKAREAWCSNASYKPAVGFFVATLE